MFRGGELKTEAKPWHMLCLTILYSWPGVLLCLLVGYCLSIYLPQTSVLTIIMTKSAEPKKKFFNVLKVGPELGVSRFKPIYMQCL
jgi:hypothetical protein